MACITSTTKSPRKDFGKQSLDIQVWAVGRRVLGLGNLDLGNFLGKRAQYLLRGIVFT